MHLALYRLVSAEGQALVETQSTALFGDVKQLTRQMQEAVGTDVNSLEEVMQRVQQAVEEEKVLQSFVVRSLRIDAHWTLCALAPVNGLVQSLKHSLSLQVEVMTVTVATQRRAVLEAIAFGSFLRDVETYVDSEYQLLTPGSSAPGSGGLGGFGPMPPDDGGSGGNGGGGSKVTRV